MTGNIFKSADFSPATTDRLGLVKPDGTTITSNNGTLTASISGKADKVTSATSGDLASLDSNGNLTDSSIAASNVVTKSSTEGLIKNDGTIDTSKHVHLQPTSSGLTGELEAKTWSDLTGLSGEAVWTDGENIYYSLSDDQYVLDKSTSTWNPKTWSGFSDIYGGLIWTDGDNIYWSYEGDNYVLNKATSTWNTKTWNGYSNIYANAIWTDGENIYYSYGDSYVLDKSTSTWNTKTWNGYNIIDGNAIWTDGENIYYSDYTNQYVLDKSTSTWNTKTWTGLTSFTGNNIWTDGDNIYYSTGSTQYVLDKSTSTWNPKSWTGYNSIDADHVWTDGENIYYSKGSSQYEFISEKTYADGYVKSDGTIDTNAKQNTALSNPVTIAGVSQTTVEGAITALVSQVYYLETTATLSTSATTPVTFTSIIITSNSCVDIGVSEWGLVPDDVTVVAGSCTVTMPKVDSARTITVRLYVK